MDEVLERRRAIRRMKLQEAIEDMFKEDGQEAAIEATNEFLNQIQNKVIVPDGMSSADTQAYNDVNKFEEDKSIFKELFNQHANIIRIKKGE